MFRKVMHCPVSFFDVTPPGRILQRFSRDMDECELKSCTNKDKSPFYVTVIVWLLVSPEWRLFYVRSWNILKYLKYT